jgi:uncharacterized repeat protein (TIGR03803 family)
MKNIIPRLFIFCGLLAGIASGQAPANDPFANSQPISGSSGSATGSNVNAIATLEPGEPATTGTQPAGRSVWYRWTAPSTSTFTFSLTDGSSKGPDFNAQLAIFTGNAPNSLASKGESDSNIEPTKPKVVELISLSAVQGQEYQIRVTGRSADSGTFTLGWRIPPPNDHFANASAVNLTYGTTTIHDNNAGATGEVGERAFGFLILQRRTVWHRILVPVGSNVSLSTAGSTFDTFVSVFRQVSSGLTGLVDVNGDNDAAGQTFTTVSFTANDSPGEYYLAVDGVDSATGDITLTFNVTPPPVYEKLFSFSDELLGDLATGSGPVGTLVQAGDGNFYGTTYTGGNLNQGTVFKMTRGGVLTTLVEFTGTVGNNKGWRPQAGLLQGSDGNFYGTTFSGGAPSFGTIFKMTPGGKLTTLVEFTGNGAENKGANPQARLLQSNDGNFYGTTSKGGGLFSGTVFRMTTSGQLTTLVEFTGTTGTKKGSEPTAGLVQGSDGNFYGTTTKGGASNQGTVFKMTPGGALAWVVELTGTTGINKGSEPTAGLMQGSDGNFYGTTSKGGASNQGTVFKLTSSGMLETMVEFTDNEGSNKGRNPKHELVQGSDGNFYGTTNAGGGPSDQGTVFKMSPLGMLETLVEFEGAGPNKNGSNPDAGLVRGSDGNFYGTTYHGGIGGVSNGINGFGTAFSMTLSGELTTLVEFTSIGVNNKGSSPEASLAQDSDGNLYGTTRVGGTVSFPDGIETRGTVFKLAPTRELTTLVRFTENGTENRGCFPMAGLVPDSNGNFYGTTSCGGMSGFGTVFKMTSGGALTTLVEFTGNVGDKKGISPKAGLVQDSLGNFYGTTSGGGDTSNNHGTVFKMTPGGALETLVMFTGTGTMNKGSNPQAGLMLGGDGNFYGTTASGGDASNHGTVFKMTPGGTLETLVVFTGAGGNKKGSNPQAGLVQDSLGNFYGTTSGSGDASNHGTVFKMTPGGALAWVMEFTGNGVANKGSKPLAGLVLGGDGNFYGTTSRGGASNYGTVFKVTPGGALTTLVEFTIPEEGNPSAPLMRASDGNLYGTTKGPDGAIYRLIFLGAPNLFAEKAEVQGTTSVLCQTMVNARGANTAVLLEYGTDGINFPNSVPIATALGGFQTTLLGTTLNNLSPGTIYHYRFRATSSEGITVSPSPVAATFSTLAEPMAATAPATDIGRTSARMNGTVNARNSDATVRFEWGTDGNSFPNSFASTPVMISGNTQLPVFAIIPEDLTPGAVYHFRLVASNAAGTVISGTSTFTTLIEPLFTLASAEALSTTRARVNGTVDARGTLASVVFEWGTNGASFPNSVAASPDSVNGSGPVPVSAILTGLTQGTTYQYRIRATGLGSAGPEGTVSVTGRLTLSILSGLVQVFPDAPPTSDGTVRVSFDPPTRGGWRFQGETSWRSSGEAAEHLESGQRLIEFLPVAGYVSPPAETVEVTGVSNFTLDRFYYETPTAGSGALTVRLKPEGLGAQWRFIGETLWRESDGAPVTGLAAGNYLIQCKPLPAEAGRTTPPNASVTVVNGGSRELTLTYFTENNAGGAPPLPLDFGSVSANEDLPFAYMGQIRSEVGSSSGFVVKRRVVATAGHVVFDDGTLSSITRLQWLFQRHAGESEPKPLEPRGYYLAAGYADQRIADSIPGEGSPQSQHLDYAALYFLEEAGRGGSAGFLASEAGDDNEFLTSTAEKILAGYAVNGVPAMNQGKLHATAAFTAALTPASGETWTTTAVRGLGGCSGGPLFVRHANGAYFPAAIYLGGSGQTVVRAIDNEVVDLFLRAEVSGNGGDNNTGGGITPTGVTTFGNTSNPGAIKVTILPSAAASAGRWGLKPEPSNRTSGSTSSGRADDDYILQLTTISGFQAPTPQTVHITGGQLTEITFTYAAEIPPPAITSSKRVTVTRGQNMTAYQIVASNSPESFSLTGDLPAGLNFNGNNGRISGTPQQAGIFEVTLGATNAGGSDTKVLTITSRPAVSNQSATAALGQPMSRQLTSSESGTDVSYSIDDLPPGTSLNEDTGLITGTPTQAGVFNSLFTVTKDGASASAILTLTVTATPLDLWRQANFLTTSNTGHAADSADPDQDGQTNRSEYAAGTNPNSGTDVFKILTSTRNATTFTVTAAGKASRSYVLERRATLTTGPWTTIVSIGPLTADASISLTDPTSPQTAAYYRLRVNAP